MDQLSEKQKEQWIADPLLFHMCNDYSKTLTTIAVKTLTSVAP